MDVKSIYESKVKTADEAAAMIEDGDRLYMGSLADTPPDFLYSLDDRYEELKDVLVTSCSLVYDMEFMHDEKYDGHIQYCSFFLMPPWERNYLKQGEMEFNSVPFSKLPHYIEHVAKVNVLAIGVSPMDEDGYMWHGPNGIAMNSIPQPHCDKIIVQICEDMPKTFGENEKIHVSEVDAIIDDRFYFIHVPAAEVTDTDQKIADYIIPHIDDGSTIQLGIGGLANAIGYGLEEKKDLGVFTEMITESMVHLMKKGVINKKVYGGFTLGSEELSTYTAQNEQVELRPIHRICDLNLIGNIDNLISVNTCLMVDLTGQIASENIGNSFIACTGGSTDFVRGATRSKGGKSFMCLASTRELNGETISNIAFSFPPGTNVTISRSDVQYVVTEYGCVDLYARSVQDRVRAMISIAHPDFRDELWEQAKEFYYMKDE